MSDQTPAEHVLFVHAHPDDETLSTGGTIATLIDAGSRVTLLTLTRGEHGEVIPPDLAHLADDPEALGTHRETELAAAVAALGIHDHRILGEPGARLAGRAPRRYRDSGMVWAAADGEQDAVAAPVDELDPQSLLAADYGELVTDVATVVGDTRPTAIVSYDAHGGYGHPDHILAHDAASHAAEVLGVPFFAITDAHSAAHARELITVDVTGMLDRKRAALRAHRSQLTLHGDTITHPGGQRHQLATVERFVRERPGQPSTKPPGIPTTVAGVILSALTGTVVGALGTASHQTYAGADGSVGFGAVAALLLVALTLAGLRLVSRTRTLAVAAGVPMVLVVAAMSSYSPGGTVLVPDNPAGVAWAYGAVILAALAIGWPRIGRYDGKKTTKGRASQ